MEGCWPPLNSGLWLYCHSQVSFRLNTDGTGFFICKECHKSESLWNHTTADHKEGGQLKDLRSVGASSCNSVDGTGQRVQFLMFMKNDDDRGNSLPSFISHDQQQISCSVHGYKIVNYHNAVAKDIPFMQLFVAFDFIISKTYTFCFPYPPSSVAS